MPTILTGGRFAVVAGVGVDASLFHSSCFLSMLARRSSISPTLLLLICLAKSLPTPSMPANKASKSFVKSSDIPFISELAGCRFAAAQGVFVTQEQI